MKGIIYLEDGTVYKGEGFGKIGTSVGELVFNTSITGYQEILTDPSYAGQIINMTYPLIGNYGINKNENESDRVYAKGFVAKAICDNPSNYMSENSVDYMLKEMDVVGVYNVDTRSITKKIRSIGSMKCIISNDGTSMEELKAILDKTELTGLHVNEVSTKTVKHVKGNGFKVAMIDYGTKNNIVQCLNERGCDITIFPYDTPYEDILNIKPDGLFLTNGPGDPKTLTKSIETVKQLIKCLPTFGICMGHQVLSLALGADTYKLKYGHRGGNHGVYDIEKDKAYITSQNHGYAVLEKDLEDKGIIITHRNLNDGTIEGIKHKSLPVYSVQFHPEGAPGPTDSYYLFDKFIDIMEQNIKSQAI